MLEETDVLTLQDVTRIMSTGLFENRFESQQSVFLILSSTGSSQCICSDGGGTF